MDDDYQIDDKWFLNGCCDKEEKVFIGFYFLYFVLIHFFFHRTNLLKPFKLLGVFVHEMGHASATWLTCGKVKTIEVYDNEGGVTRFTGGWRCVVIPAGYVGGAFWGGVMVALSGNRTGATVAACLVAVALIVALAHNPNKTVVHISIGFLLVTLVALAVDWFLLDPFLQYFTLFYGVFFGYYAIRDIWEDTIKETRDGSDAVACHQYIKCCLPKCVGLQFMLLGLVFQFLGIYLALFWLTQTDSSW